MGSHLLQTWQRLEERLQLAPGRGEGLVWLCLSSKGKGEPDPSKEGQAAKKEVKEAAEERGGVPG